MAHAIVFVHLGAGLPSWLRHAVDQARSFNEACPIYVVAERRALAGSELGRRGDVVAVPTEGLRRTAAHDAFDRLSRLDKGFRGGFWTYTTERFFWLEAAMNAAGLSNVIHLESDVMLYASVDDLAPKLSRLYPAIGATFDNDTRAIPGFVFVRDATAIGRLTAFIAESFDSLSGAPQSAWRAVNDMSLLAGLRSQTPDAVEHLPVVPKDYPLPLRSPAGHVVADSSAYWRNADELGMVFDAAALGQYLGGIDPRNAGGSTPGFVNESAVYDPRVLRPEMRLDGRGRRVPWVAMASGEFRVGCLHIHSKNLAPYLSVDQSVRSR